MRTLKLSLPILFAGILALSAALTGCDDAIVDSSTANSFTINGGTYNNVDVTGGNTVAVVSDTITTVTMTGTLDGEPFTLSIVFNGITARNYPWVSNGTVGLSVGSGSSVKNYLGTTGNTKVNSFGQIGGKVEGTFSGTLMTTPSGTVEIDGRFSASRQ